jgi:hypothetical protein
MLDAVVQVWVQCLEFSSFECEGFLQGTFGSVTQPEEARCSQKSRGCGGATVLVGVTQYENDPRFTHNRLVCLSATLAAGRL